VRASEAKAFETVARVLRDEARDAQAHGGHALAQELRRGSGRVEGWARLIVDRHVQRATRRG